MIERKLIEKRFKLLMHHPNKHIPQILKLCIKEYRKDILSKREYPDMTFFFTFIRNLNITTLSRDNFLDILEILEEMNHSGAFNVTFEAIAGHHSLVNQVISDLLATLLNLKNRGYITSLIKTLSRSLDEHADKFLFTLHKIDYNHRNIINLALLNSLSPDEDYYTRLLGIFLDDLDRINPYHTIIDLNNASRILHYKIKKNYSKPATRTLATIHYSMITNQLPSIINEFILKWKDIPKFTKQKNYTTWKEVTVPHPQSRSYSELFSKFLKALKELNMLKDHYLYILQKITDLPSHHRKRALYHLRIAIPRKKLIENYGEFFKVIESLDSSEDKITSLLEFETIVKLTNPGSSTPKVKDVRNRLDECFIKTLQERIKMHKKSERESNYSLWHEFLSLCNIIEDSQLVNRIIVQKKLTHIINFFLHIDVNDKLLNMFKEKVSEIKRRFPKIADYSALHEKKN